MRKKILKGSRVVVEHVLGIIKRKLISLELTNAELVPFVQPIFCGQSLVGCEVLLRIKKEGVYYSPESKIAEVEETELINKITCDLFAGVREHFSSHRHTLPDKFQFSFNICAHQMKSQSVINAVSEFNNHFKGYAELSLEIVERGIVHFDDLALGEMDKLVSEGVKFSIDDFGSGSASLKYLDHAGFSTVKIDKSMTIMYEGVLVYADIIESIVLLSRKLNVQVVAEGVESVEQFKLLQFAGVKYFQGYWFSKPVAMNELFK